MTTTTPTQAALPQSFVDVVFDKLPSDQSFCFVECEDPAGRSYEAGEWIDRGAGRWALRISLATRASEAAPLTRYRINLNDGTDSPDECGGYYRDTDVNAAMADLRLLVQKLARSLRKAAPTNDLSDKAMDYLKRKGLTGSVLRGEAAPVAVGDAKLGKMLWDLEAEQSFLGTCREACDDTGKARWDRLQRISDYLASQAALDAQQASECASLEGLRERLLAPREIVRDKEGWLSHPDFPDFDEDVDAQKFLEAFHVEAAFVSMESDDPVGAERYFEAGEPDCSYWTPTAPDGNGWMLLDIYDTEDGPYALFARDAYEVEKAAKREHTRAMHDRIVNRAGVEAVAPTPDAAKGESA